MVEVGVEVEVEVEVEILAQTPKRRLVSAKLLLRMTLE
jgi:hypothetical protein